jgi:hypothetical protein
MAVAVHERLALFSHSGNLAHAGKRVELAEDGNHRSAFASFAHDGCRQARDAALDAKTIGFELPRMLLGRAVFLVVRFRHIPDAVTQREKGFTLCFDDVPHGFDVFHDFQTGFISHSIQNWRQFMLQILFVQSVCMNKFWTTSTGSDAYRICDWRAIGDGKTGEIAWRMP